MKNTIRLSIISLVLTIILMPLSLQAQKAGYQKSFEVFEGMTIDMVWIPEGSFIMGNTSGVEDRWSAKELAHQVKISKGFWMAKYETTQDLWEVVMGKNPSSHQAEKHPVTDVSWHEVMAFIQTLQRFDSKFDLPTEAQWEHAAKANTNKAYSLPRDQITWHRENSAGTPQAIGAKRANPWGLCDIHGNVGEWTKDWLAPFTSEAQTDPTGPETGERKLIKGGQFTGRLRHTMSFDRQSALPDTRHFFVGFRIIRRE